MVKVVVDSETNGLLGVHILGPEAPIIIHEAALAIKTGAVVTDIQQTLHAHPNLSEALWEAALDATSENLYSRDSKDAH
jgi:dihydrolipoamide dehydrogenase